MHRQKSRKKLLPKEKLMQYPFISFGIEGGPKMYCTIISELSTEVLVIQQENQEYTLFMSHKEINLK